MASEKQYPRLMSMRDIIRTEADQYATVIRIRFILHKLTMSKILKKTHIVHQNRQLEAFNSRLKGFEFAFFIIPEYLCTMEFHNTQV